MGFSLSSLAYSLVLALFISHLGTYIGHFTCVATFQPPLLQCSLSLKVWEISVDVVTQTGLHNSAFLLFVVFCSGLHYKEKFP